MFAILKKLKKAKIQKIEEISDGNYLISISKVTEFKPGQVVELAIEKSAPKRMYSLAGSVSSKNLQILFDVKQDGYLTPLLQKKNKNDVIFCSEAFGNFLSDVKPNPVFIATGTGIAPFLSYYFSGNKNITVIQGSRTPQGLFFYSRLKELNENYIPCCTSKSCDGLYNGRVTQYLKQHELNAERHYYLCGSAEMIVDVRDLLLEKGIPFGNILTEIYF